MTVAKKKNPAKKPRAKCEKKPAAKTGPAKKKRGNPSKYNPDQHPFMAWALAIRGKTNKEIAAGLSISTGTLFSWGRVHPEFLSALKSGKDVADAKVENSLFQRAFGYEYEEVKEEDDCGDHKITKTLKHVPGDVTACIFWLKNRRPAHWKDKQVQEITGKDGAPLIPAHEIPDEEIEKRAREILAKRRK